MYISTKVEVLVLLDALGLYLPHHLHLPHRVLEEKIGDFSQKERNAPLCTAN